MINFYQKLKGALSKTSSKISEGIEHIFIKKRLDEESIEELEELLLFADVGAVVTQEIIAQLRQKKFDKEVSSEEIKRDLSQIVEAMLSKQNHEFKLQEGRLNVILVCGVNGNGKTTTIGKLADLYIKQGKKVSIAACDTFRAAAVEQIKAWSDRSGAKFYQGKDKSDPASVAHMAVTNALADGDDILFIDTAGRLHNHENLMQELAKIIRVVQKIDDAFPQHSLLVIDGTTGQNAITQVEHFKKIAKLTGVAITKLDGTAKAGAVIAIVQNHQLPINFIGIGEKIDDLKSFSAKEFSDALIGLGNLL
ncbi:MAG: hypothetical protein DGJ47_000184 [Rickettsiaceae bacterium]